MIKNKKKQLIPPTISNHENEKQIADKNYWYNKALIGYDVSYFNHKKLPFPDVFEFAPSEIKEDREIALFNLVKGKGSFSHLPKKFAHDKQFILDYIKETPYFFFWDFSEELRDDDDICFAAFKKEVHSFRYFSQHKQLNQSFVLQLAHINGLILEYIPSELQNNADIALAAISQNPKAIQFITKKLSSSLCKNIEWAKDVLAQFPEAYPYLSAKLRNDYQFSKPYLDKNISFLEYTGVHIKENPDILIHYAKYGIGSLLNAELKNNPDFMLKLIQANSKHYRYLSLALSQNIDFVRQAFLINYHIYPDLNYYIKFQENAYSFKDDPVILYELFKNPHIINPDYDPLAEYRYTSYNNMTINRKDKEILITSASLFTKTTYQRIKPYLKLQEDFITSEQLLSLQKEFKEEADMLLLREKMDKELTLRPILSKVKL